MKIDRETIRRVAELARLKLDEVEEKEMETQLVGILDYMEVLGELDLESVRPTAHTLGFTSVTRQDEEKESFSRDVVEKLAPEWDRGHVVVPRIV